MRVLDHFQEYKDSIKTLGRELESYVVVDGNVISQDKVLSVTVSYEGVQLKSIMKKMVIETSQKINIGSWVTVNLKVANNSIGFSGEYISFWRYIVYEEEYREDSKHYIYTCYDQMLKAMKDYDYVGINYHFPMTVKEYAMDLCATLGIEFSSYNVNFANYDKMIESDPFLTEDGQSLGYTYRDVFDQLAEVTASVIWINENGRLEIKYLADTGDTIDDNFLKDVNVGFKEKYGPINSVVLTRSGGSDSIYLKDDDSIAQNGLCEVKISDNQIMNGNDRDKYLPDIFAKLNGVEYYLNDYASTGITYYEPGDIYTIEVGENEYKCAMLNDEINISTGLSESVYTEMPEQAETPYDKADKTDRRINEAYIIVDKQNGKIEEYISRVEQAESDAGEAIEIARSTKVETDEYGRRIEVLEEKDGTLVNSLVTININGINVSTNLSAISTMITNEKFVVMNGEVPLAYFGYDEDSQSTKAEVHNLTVQEYLIAGVHRVETIEINGEDRTGWFYIG